MFAVPELADIMPEVLSTVSGLDMTLAMMLRLAQRLAPRDNVHGAVITHGTDTLQESAWLLHLTAVTNGAGDVLRGETPLRILFGNKQVAQSLGARFRAGGWYASADVSLAGFWERGWL